MPLESNTNKILYVPFNNDYIVDNRIKKMLTEKEFFDNCFLHSKYEQYEEYSIFSTKESGTAINPEEYYVYIDEQDSAYKAFTKWMKYDENAIYIVKGDAGSGKTTYLHYLKYSRKDNNECWCVIDIQNAISEIHIGNKDLNIPRFNTLYAKVFSAIILEIKKIMNIHSFNNYSDTLCQILRIQNNYKSFLGYDITTEVDDFFTNFSSVSSGKKICDLTNEECQKICRDYKIQFYLYFSSILSKYQYEDVLRILLKLLMCVLKCDNMNSKIFITFDNFERFVGTDEIFCSELILFIEQLRHFFESLSNEYANLGRFFQFIVFVRNTSTRMFTPQQISDFAPHELDVSDWFSTQRIVEKKIDWYEKYNIEITDVERIKQVLADFGAYNNEFYGLRPKLDMLFNYNKRIIIEFLTKTFTSKENEKYLEKYDYFWNESDLPSDLKKFAARSIITRLIYNQLRVDGFFKNIIVQRESKGTSSKGYARRILTILNNYKLKLINSHKTRTRIIQNSYMPFNELIEQLFCNENNPVETYFSIINTNRRKIISKVLFFMNYYNRRSGNWVQFIDIQYNIDGYESINIPDEHSLFELIDSKHDSIKMRITNAGIAYLTYIVQSFEYFSSKYYSLNNDIEIPPLLCCLPTKEELQTVETNKIKCLEIIKLVFEEAMFCIQQMQLKKIDKIIIYKKNYSDNGLTHAQRIINHHRGYLDNFIECCFKELYPKIKNDHQLESNFNKLINEILNIRQRYRLY